MNGATVRAEAAARDGVVPLLAISGVTVLVIVGLSRGIWVSNLHNGALAVAFTAVGAHVLHQRPGHREGRVLVAAGVVEAVMFLGRQIGHDPAPGTSPWWGWLGVWPLAIALGLGTLSILLFPDGRLPSPRWRTPVAVATVLVVVSAAISALWPVEYASAGVTMPPPFTLPGADTAEKVWSALAHPLYIALQVSWLVAVVTRWRTSGPIVRRQLALVGVAAAVSVLTLAVGLIGWGTPTPGLLAVVLVPVAAGFAIVHGRHLATYTALTWLSRTTPTEENLPGELAAATADALSADRAVVWMRHGDDFHAIGVWPESGQAIDPVREDELFGHGGREGSRVLHADAVVGAVTVERHHPLSRSDVQVLDGLAAQADLVIRHLDLAARVARRPATDGLDALTAREREVLELMARGFTNAAICAELHLSIKTVEPAVSSIFAKLDLPPDTRSNRRVLAVLAYVRAESP